MMRRTRRIASLSPRPAVAVADRGPRAGNPSTRCARRPVHPDRRKVAIYARIGVPVYWLLDVEARRLEVRSQPSGGEYRSTRVLGENDSVTLPGTAIAWSVASLLP